MANCKRQAHQKRLVWLIQSPCRCYILAIGGAHRNTCGTTGAPSRRGLKSTSRQESKKLLSNFFALQRPRLERCP
eukprot:5505838-Amphidinium_carterae.1